MLTNDVLPEPYLAKMLSLIGTKHESKETSPGVWQHTFTPSLIRTVASGPRLVETVSISGTDQYGNEQTETIRLFGLRLKELAKLRKLQRLRKIKRRQRRAAQRRLYRGK